MNFAVKPPRIVLTYGRFDLFHQGHIQFIRAVSRHADHVIIGCATDALSSARGRPCHMPFSQRRDVLERCRFVSRVIPYAYEGQARADIVNYNAGILVVSGATLDPMNDIGDIVQVLNVPRIEPMRQTQAETLEPFRLAM